MSQLAFELDPADEERLNEEARRRGMTTAQWLKQVVEEHLHEPLPQSFFQVLGSWEDDREPDEILADIRRNLEQPAGSRVTLAPRRPS